jgi:ribosomal protein S12 methylthiotransferase accessory factor
MTDTKHHADGLRFVGGELRPFPDGATMLISPAGRLYRIEAAADEVWRFLTGMGAPRSTDPGPLAEIATVLQADGCVRAGPPLRHASDWARFGTRVRRPEAPLGTRLLLLGDPELLQQVDRLALEARFAEVRSLAAGETSWQEAVELADPATTVVVLIRRRLEQDQVLALGDACAGRELRWVQLHFEQRRAWAGPAVQPHRTPDYRDVLGRRLAAAEFATTFETQLAPNRHQAGPAIPPRHELQWVLGRFFAELERWLADGPTVLVGNEVELDPVTFETSLHPVLPLPHRSLPGDARVNSTLGGWDLLLDDRTGIVNHLQRLEHHPSIPSELVTVQSHVADMRRLYIWANNTVCSGSTFGELQASRGAAFGEGLERYCGNWIQKGIITRTSYRELVARGEHAVDPADLVLYSDAQYAHPGFPFVPFGPDLAVHWVRGRSVTRDRDAWVPASLVYVNWYLGEFADDPPTNFLYYPGLAAGPTLDRAVASGLEEVIERHVTMVWWANAHPLPAVHPPSELDRYWHGRPTELGQRAWLIHLDNEFGVPVMAGVVANDRESLLNIGFDAHADPVAAARKAWTEALTLQDGSRDLDLEHGLFRQAVAAGQLNAGDLKPWRADRRYLDDYRDDMRDVTDLMCQQQIFLDPRARDRVSPWVEVKAGRSMEELPRLPDRSLASYRAVVEARGFEVFYVDVTTPDVAPSGYRVVRVVVPGMIPNWPAAFPFLGRRRVQDIPVELGWRGAPAEEHELNYFPMPHA